MQRAPACFRYQFFDCFKLNQHKFYLSWANLMYNSTRWRWEASEFSWAVITPENISLRKVLEGRNPLIEAVTMRVHDVKTFFCRMNYRDKLDGHPPIPFVESAFICIDEDKVLRVFDGQELHQWIFALDLIPEQPLFTVDLENTRCAIDFKRVVSANRNHLRGRMRLTADFGSGLERLIFKFPMDEYTRLEALFRSFEG